MKEVEQARARLQRFARCAYNDTKYSVQGIERKKTQHLRAIEWAKFEAAAEMLECFSGETRTAEMLMAKEAIEKEAS